MKQSIVVLVIGLAGCVTRPPAPQLFEPVALPDGSRGYAVYCQRHISACMNGAAAACGGGPYHIIEWENRDAGTVAVPLGNGAVAVNAIHRTMIVKCGTP